MSIEVTTSWGSRLPLPERVRITPIADALAGLAAAIRARIPERGESADGGDFGEWPERRNSRGAPWRVWIYPGQSGAPVPRTYARQTKSGGGGYYVDLRQYMRQVHGDGKRRFSVSGALWQSLGVRVANSRKVNTIFRGSSPSLKGRGETVPNRTKARTAQMRMGKDLLEPSDSEVQAVLNAFLHLADEELARIAGGTPEPRRLPRASHPVSRSILARRNPLR